MFVAFTPTVDLVPPSMLSAMLDDIDLIDTLDEASGLLGQLEVASRQIDAAKVILAARVHTLNLHRAGGYIKVSSWARTVARVSSRDATNLSRSAQLVATYPDVGQHYVSGTIGTDHLRRLAALHDNKRVTDQLGEFIPLFVEWATTLDLDTFNSATMRWEQLADANGSHEHADCVHTNRDAHIHTYGDTTYVSATVANLQGALLHQVHERFIQRELDTDLTERDLNGDTEMPRTAKQRRADALTKIFTAAADILPPSVEPLINIVIDAHTYETALAAILANENLPTLTGTPAEFPSRRCETTYGIIIDPIEAVIASFTSQIRRVVFNTSSTVIDLSRRSRLFTGASREAVFLRGKQCIWPGCSTHNTQADHLTPWSQGGPTTPDNGAPLCGHHNRLKNSGYTTTRQADGHIEVRRPDGQLLAPI